MQKQGKRGYFGAFEEYCRKHMGYDGLHPKNNERVERMKKWRLSSKEIAKDESSAFPNRSPPCTADAVSSIASKIRSNDHLRRKLAFQGPHLTDDEIRWHLETVARSETDCTDDLLQNNGFRGQFLQTSGHVFVCNGSVCDLACDAFLCPGAIGAKKDRVDGRIFSQWRRRVLAEKPGFASDLMDSSSKEHWFFALKRYDGRASRVASFRKWPWKKFRDKTYVHSPFPVIGEVSLKRSEGGRSGVALSESDHVDALMATVSEFVLVALTELREHQPNANARRDRYLLALPVLGTGYGSAGDLTGLIVDRMIRVLCNFACVEADVDFVLVCADEAMYSHAQYVRAQLMKEDEEQSAGQDMLPSFRLLTAEQNKKAKHLAKMATGASLSLFLGAGVSMASGLPSWFGLLEQVEDQFSVAGTPQERILGDQCGWDPLQMAERLAHMSSTMADRFGNWKTLKERICKLLQSATLHPGLLLMLLVSLGCQSIVTQNYDELIERAYKLRNLDEHTASTLDPSRLLSVIPHGPVVRGAHQWLLKMHGCVNFPSSIVITEEDYKDYGEGQKKALSGLVQANLMTSHFLFVGFSLTDPNYLRIVDEVRGALAHTIPTDLCAQLTGAGNQE